MLGVVDIEDAVSDRLWAPLHDISPEDYEGPPPVPAFDVSNSWLLIDPNKPSLKDAQLVRVANIFPRCRQYSVTISASWAF